MSPDPLTAALSIGSQVISRLWPDPADQAKAQLALLELAQRGELAQLDVNKVEAASPSVFISGGRPFIIWVCGMAFAWNWIGLPVARFAAAYFGHPLDIAPADMSEMMPVLLGLLGLGGLRTFEKVKGVAS